jgi:cytochrome c biogenesis protein CcmG, thiol:disulfide interchange protein DsbE
MKATISIIVVIVIIFLGFLLFKDDSKDAVEKNDTSVTKPLESGSTNENGKSFDKAPNFSLQDIDGNTVSLDDFRGKVLVINSWATWCPFCIDEIPDFVSLQEEFGDKIVVIAINRQESLEKSKSYTDGLGVTDGLLYLLDPRDSFYKNIGGFSMPETIFVDGNQNIIIHKRGPMELDEMITKVNQTLSSKL